MKPPAKHKNPTVSPTKAGETSIFGRGPQNAGYRKGNVLCSGKYNDVSFGPTDPGKSQRTSY